MGDEMEKVKSCFKAIETDNVLEFMIFSVGLDKSRAYRLDNPDHEADITFLQYAVVFKSVLTAEYLIRAGVDLNVIGLDGRPAFTTAMFAGSDEILHMLVNAGVNKYRDVSFSKEHVDAYIEKVFGRISLQNG